MKKAGLQNLTPEMAEGINLNGTQRYSFGSTVGGDPSRGVKYDPLKPRRKRVKKRLAARKQPKAKVSYSKVRIYFGGGEVVFNRKLTPRDVAGLFPSAFKIECLSKSGAVLMVLDVPKRLFK